jgi:hypothetical protein
VVLSHWAIHAGTQAGITLKLTLNTSDPDYLSPTSIQLDTATTVSLEHQTPLNLL